MVSPFESPDHSTAAFLCPCVYPFFIFLVTLSRQTRAQVIQGLSTRQLTIPGAGGGTVTNTEFPLHDRPSSQGKGQGDTESMETLTSLRGNGC